MKHLFICREYPPASGGGIGSYVYQMGNLLARHGETVHIIGQRCSSASRKIEKRFSGRLIVHRVPFENDRAFFKPKPSSYLTSDIEKRLFQSDYYPQCFSWTASRYAEQLIEQEKIDIIEAQEFEAPLFYLQFRRAMRSGPKHQPPCIVHLHSPTEFIRKYNEWPAGAPYETADLLESFSIRSADALICPSRYLATQIEDRYRVPENSIRIIPYPLPDMAKIKRHRDTWRQGTICYIGRLERRKGILEWIRAAGLVAGQIPDLHFDFIGHNILGTERLCGDAVVSQWIPKHLKRRFHFHGVQQREAIAGFLKKARICVVPSRWENFPNTCIEAMCSGLPVLASPNGGMAEMIEDGRTGWIAPKMDVENLAKTLRRALDNSPDRIAGMGEQAAFAVRRLCDRENIFESHMDFKTETVRKGAVRSLRRMSGFPFTKGLNAEFQKIGHVSETKSSVSLYNQKTTLRKVLSKAYMIISGMADRLSQEK